MLQAWPSVLLHWQDQTNIQREIYVLHDSSRCLGQEECLSEEGKGMKRREGKTSYRFLIPYTSTVYSGAAQHLKTVVMTKICQPAQVKAKRD